VLELKKLRKQDQLSPDLVFRDPYFLDFLSLKGAFQEKDLEAAILREMESFILELGAGFSFVARQKRMQIGSNDYYLDCFFTIAVFGVSSPLSSSWKNSRRLTRDRWSFTCVGWKNTSANQESTRRWV